MPILLGDWNDSIFGFVVEVVVEVVEVVVKVVVEVISLQGHPSWLGPAEKKLLNNYLNVF